MNRNILDPFLTSAEQDSLCKYSLMAVCAAAIIVGLRCCDMDLINEHLGDNSPKKALAQNEKLAYGVILAAGILCAWCNFMRR